MYLGECRNSTVHGGTTNWFQCTDQGLRSDEGQDGEVYHGAPGRDKDDKESDHDIC